MNVYPDYQVESFRFCQAAFILMDDVIKGKIPVPITLYGPFELAMSSNNRLVLRDLDKPKNTRVIAHMYNKSNIRSDITRIGDMLASYLEALQVKYEDN